MTLPQPLDVGRGLNDVSLRDFDETPILDSGDVRVRALGWQEEGVSPLWRIEQSIPLPFTLLSVAMELKVND